MKTPSNNTELYRYLVSVGDLLSERGGASLAERVRAAARQATDLSTEFLGEARDALIAVVDTGGKSVQLRELRECVE